MALVDTQPYSIMRVEMRGLRIGCWITLIAIAIVRAWFTRYEFDGDSVSYLDIARAIAEGHPGAAINAVWSPGYPVLLSLFLWLFRPNAYWECLLAHVANVSIFVFALASFQLFWSDAWALHKTRTGQAGAPIPKHAFWMLGYSIFAIATLNMVPVGRVGPDLLVAAFVCLAGSCTLRFQRKSSFGQALMLGLVLALGYYAKAPFFPMGLVIILCACGAWPVTRRTTLLCCVALLAFLLACSPLIAALSIAEGRLTFGDTARMNYAFHIDGVQHYQHWQGGPVGAGMPIHPTRLLNKFPEIYEFADKDMGTYPPWFDPAHWYEGIKPHFLWKMQGKVLVSNLLLELQLLMASCAGILCAVIILALVSRSRVRWISEFWRLWFVWLPGSTAMFMYAVVLVEPRYIGGWLILLFAGAICASSHTENANADDTAGYIAIAAVVMAVAALLSQATKEAMSPDYAAGRSPRHAVIADFLLNHGVHPGDRVAVIGHGTEAYWAHLARLQVVAEIPAHIASHHSHPALDFWGSGIGQQQKALKIIEGTGAVAVVAGSQLSMEGAIPSVVPAPWKNIDGTDAYVYFFRLDPQQCAVQKRSDDTTQ